MSYSLVLSDKMVIRECRGTIISKGSEEKRSKDYENIKLQNEDK